MTDSVGGLSPAPRGPWSRAASVISRRVAGETVLVPLNARATDPEFKGARLYVLNETGEFLWGLLESPRTTADLARNLTLEFETAEDRALADVEGFLVQLRGIGAVREANEPHDE